jgi:hypothetical protein
MAFVAAADLSRQCTSADNRSTSSPFSSWTTSPQLVAFTFQGPISTSSIKDVNLIKLASSKPVPSTWFASGSSVDDNVLAELRSNGVEFGAFATTGDELTAALRMLTSHRSRT